MKKLFVIIAILFSVNCSAQDTTYYLKGNKLYQVITINREVCPDDKNAMVKYTEQRLRNKRKVRRINRIAIGVFVLFNILAWK